MSSSGCPRAPAESCRCGLSRARLPTSPPLSPWLRSLSLTPSLPVADASRFGTQPGAPTTVPSPFTCVRAQRDAHVPLPGRLPTVTVLGCGHSADVGSRARLRSPLALHRLRLSGLTPDGAAHRSASAQKEAAGGIPPLTLLPPAAPI